MIVIRSLFKVTTFILLAAIALGLVISFLYPIGYKEYIERYSKEQGIDPFLVSAVINVESKFNKDARSNKNAKGLMQISPQTGLWGAEELAIEGYSEGLLYDPETNIRIGTWYIKKLQLEFDNNLDLVLAAYNAGSGNVRKWLGNPNYSLDGKDLNRIPFKETEDYLRKVEINYSIYRSLYKNYMEKPDSINSIYIDVIITIRTILVNLIKSFR